MNLFFSPHVRHLEQAIDEWTMEIKGVILYFISRKTSSLAVFYERFGPIRDEVQNVIEKMKQ
jgi:hypothetical protein